MPTSTAPVSVYQIITDEIIKKLDEGVVPWRQPWKNGMMPMNFVSKRPYSGINAFLLWCSEYDSPYWLTFKQCSDLGGKVKKGEHGTMVVYWKVSDYKAKNEDGKIEEKKGFLLRYFRVFNTEQCEGLTMPKEEPRVVNHLSECEKIIKGYKKAPTVIIAGSRASYSPKLDEVHMPPRKDFESDEAFYATLFHEFTHSTGHEKRLKREGIMEQHFFGDAVYSKEELIAEFGSAFLCGTAGIAPSTLIASASYIKHWKEALKADNKMLISAASKAQKATEHILGIEKDYTQKPKAKAKSKKK